MSKQPIILISNDDGITAGGIASLIAVAKDYGHVVVIAPDSPQSAQGHSITIEDPIRLRRVHLFGPDVEAYECSGTPVDCIKIAKYVVLKDRPVRLCLSGVNHGSNASTNVLYSGTMSAAMEASLEGIPSIGFSLLDFSADADFATSQHIIRRLVDRALKHGLGNADLLNVNIPKLPLRDLKGIRICRQAKGHWAEDFQEGEDPMGRKYYWLKGKYIYQDEGDDSDIWALENGFVSVVPVMHDLTDYKALDSLDHLTGCNFCNFCLFLRFVGAGLIMAVLPPTNLLTLTCLLMFKNKFLNGFITGVIIPLVAFVVVYYLDRALASSTSVNITGNDKFLWTGFKESTLVLIAFCFNLIPTYIANKRYMEEFIRGIMVPTVIYCFIWFFYYKSSLF